MLKAWETRLFRLATDNTARHKADEYWYTGVFLGVETGTSEMLLTTGAKVYKCSHHNVRRVTREESYAVD